MTPSTSANPPVIRDAAMRLFAEPGGDRTTVRDIAAAAGVSPALVIRHFGSMDGLREAVDAHVAAQIRDLLARLAAEPAEGLDPSRSGEFASVADEVFRGSALPRYVLRSLTDGGERGTALAALLIQSSTQTWDSMVAAGVVEGGPDPQARAALVALLDLAVLALREPLASALGNDPLTGEGAARWTAEVARMLSYTAPRAGAPLPGAQLPSTTTHRSDHSPAPQEGTDRD